MNTELKSRAWVYFLMLWCDWLDSSSEQLLFVTVFLPIWTTCHKRNKNTLKAANVTNKPINCDQLCLCRCTYVHTQTCTTTCQRWTVKNSKEWLSRFKVTARSKRFVFETVWNDLNQFCRNAYFVFIYYIQDFCQTPKTDQDFFFYLNVKNTHQLKLTVTIWASCLEGFKKNHFYLKRFFFFLKELFWCNKVLETFKSQR